MTVGEEKRQKTKYHTLLWLILAVIIIIIFIILSTIIIGGRILDMAQREGNVIELDTNESYESSSKSSTGKSNLQDDEQIDIGDDKSKGLEVSDDNAKWETSTTVDIFKEAYENESGDISVKSEDGDKVIAPGTSNEYEFKLKNTGKTELEYKMTFEGMFTLEHEDIPIKVRLKKGDFWILGGNEEWVEPSELDEVVENGSLGINKIAQYELDWMWAFEDDTSDSIIRDTADTNLGNISVDSKIDFKLTINVETEAIPNPDIEDDLRTGKVKGKNEGILGNKGLLPLAVSLGTIWGTGIILFLIIIFWRRHIYVTGFIIGGNVMKMGKKEFQMKNTRFVFEKARFGKRTWKLCMDDEVIAEMTMRIKRKKKYDDERIQGIALEYNKDKDLWLLMPGKKGKVIAVELYLTVKDGKISIRQDHWAAIDKKHNVYTENGMTGPDDNDYNITPDGLSIDDENALEVVIEDGKTSK